MKVLHELCNERGLLMLVTSLLSVICLSTVKSG